MSDSFADLWNSSAPTKPTPPPQKLGSVTPQLSSARRPQNDVFSLLSSAGSSAPNSRPITPSMAGVTPQLKAISKPPVKGTAGGDAFSSLLVGSLGGSSSNGANMTIAERAARVEKERRENLQKHHQTVNMQASAWDGLDTLASSSPSAQPTTTIHPVEDDDDWGFASTAPARTTSQNPSVKPPPSRPPAEEDDWDLGDFSSPSAPKSHSPVPPPLPARSQAIWDLDPFSSPPAESNPSPSPPLRSQTPGDFDFGDREDRLLDDDSQDEDDILGVLSKPVDAIPKRASPSNHSNRTTPPPLPPRGSRTSSNNSSRPVSPPPHILGQIVEMGFSIQQARVALAATDTGVDVQAALETLLSNGAAASERPPSRQESPEPRQRRPTRGNPSTAPRERLVRDTPSPSGSQQERNIQEQADKLLAQASEIGLSVFNRANAFWNTGKEKVQKAYEERAKAAATAEASGDVDGSGGGSGPSRPRWMKESAAKEDGDWNDGGFSDELPPPNLTRVVRPKAESESQPQPQAKPQTADLFSDEPVAYVSPFRRGQPKAQQSVDPTPKPPPPRVPSPVRFVPRQSIVSASLSAIAASAKHKAVGGEKFKLGQYGEAESAYSNAIAVLPNSHLLLVPLYNNRALTRLKTGDHSGAVEDATIVVTLVGAGYHPQREAKVSREEEGAGVDLGDGLVKAWRRRAEAFEGKEKWEAAQNDWEAVAAAEWAGGKLRSEAVRGAGRCRRMVTANMDSGASLSSAAKPKPKPKPTAVPPRPTVRRGPTPPSQALSNLRKANNAAEAEDQARHDLKDTVDARLVGWKAGKETNVRALIASLDTVLWPELGWQKVGMADLVMSSQVKIRYTKAIAKLHPDKLNGSNTTLEQRMIANGVFGTLNEAWNAFKQ